MPNYVSNRIRVRGERGAVEALVHKAGSAREGAVVSLGAFVPQPPDLNQGGCSHPHRYGSYTEEDLKCWYPWNVTNWGTKWDATNSRVRYEEAGALNQLAEAAGPVPEVEAVLLFETAWSPPTPVLEAMTAQHPDVDIEHEWLDEGYCTQGMAVYGRDGTKSVEYYSAEDERVRDLSMELRGHDPWAYCYECGGDLDEDIEPEPDPQMCHACG